MELDKHYNYIDAESKWYKQWYKNKLFTSNPNDQEPFTIVIPPPNVTGVLHMGHMLNNTIQDVLARKARMNGKNVCWVAGTDHASIATEAKVSKKLADQGINKKDLSRDDFLDHAWEWTREHGGIILEQLKHLGVSCDWNRTKFTLDKDMYDSVIETFIALHDKGYLYQGYRMVNWDCKAQTAVSDEEVIHKQVNSKLYYIKYNLTDQKEQVIIATTRPETLLGDTAICVHPEDERYKHLVGQQAIIPIIGKQIPVICDEYVDISFGTGCLKVTPAHDTNDYELGKKHGLDMVNILFDNGTMDVPDTAFHTLDRFAARKAIVKQLDEMDLLLKVEDITNNIGYSERTDALIEPRISKQWFCKMEELAKPAIEAVQDGTIQFHPSNVVNTYMHWMNNIKDWCISRQLMWGQRIPVYYYNNQKEFVVARSLEEALELAQKASNNANLTAADLHQDPDVLDTWFSSWLWPISVFNGILEPDNEDIKYYYPTNDLVTAPEILFFWVARMIMAGYFFKNQPPFKNVYFTGIVRDEKRRKMSKSLGNSPDPIELMKKYSADGVRVGMLLSSPAGNDLLFDEVLCEQGRNFTNKIWNALKLIKSFEVSEEQGPDTNKAVIDWFEAKLTKTVSAIDAYYEQYRLSDVLMEIYRLIWTDYCSWYLEAIKPAFGATIDRQTYNATVSFFKKLMQLAHPFIPFISEEVWTNIRSTEDAEYITISQLELNTVDNEGLLEQFERVQAVIGSIRDFRKQQQISPKEKIEAVYVASTKQPADFMEAFNMMLVKLSSLSSLKFISTDIDDEQYTSLAVGNITVGLQYKADTTVNIENAQKELEYLEGLLRKSEQKLLNEKFVRNAPQQVVDKERKIIADTEEKIVQLKAVLKEN